MNRDGDSNPMGLEKEVDVRFVQKYQTVVWLSVCVCVCMREVGGKGVVYWVLEI